MTGSITPDDGFGREEVRADLVRLGWHYDPEARRSA
jgi:hypothetical protein